MKENKFHFLECNIAGIQYHDIFEVWDELKIGARVTLEAEPDNKYDANAVQIIFRGKDESGDENDFLLGYVPRGENVILSGLLRMGWGEMFECRISKISPDADYYDQVHIVIKVPKRTQSEQVQLPTETIKSDSDATTNVNEEEEVDCVDTFKAASRQGAKGVYPKYL